MKKLLVANFNTDTDMTVSVSPKAVQERDCLISALSAIADIKDTETRDKLISIVSQAKAHLAAVEESRKAVKSPVLKMGRMIDAAAAEHVKALQKSVEIAERKLGEFEQHARLASKEKARDAKNELARAQKERARLLAEAQKLHSEAALEKDEHKAAEIIREAFNREIEAFEIADKAAHAAIAKTEEASSMRASNGAQRMTYTFDVYDLHALYAFDRECVTLTPVFSRIKILASFRNWELPGVRVVPKPVYNVKLTT